MAAQRHGNTGSEVRQEIMEAITADGDVPQRTLLKIMLMVLDEIGGKIDVILRDEQGLRETVLNGHTDRHEAHHDWIEVQMLAESDNKRSARKIAESVVEKFLYSVLVFAAGAFVMRLFGG